VTARRTQRALALAGVLGGLLYMAGDALFYGQLGSGHDFDALTAMKARSDALLIAGGAVAPFASAGYILGTLAMALELRRRYPRSAAVFFVSWTCLFLTGIAYHSVYTTRGFAAKLPDPALAEVMLGRIKAFQARLYAFEVVSAAAGTLAVVVAIARGSSGYPRWLLLLLPTIWSLADAVAEPLPAPIGGVVSGLWINGWFTVFFLAAWLGAERRT
jgi:hypothetical protein